MAAAKGNSKTHPHIDFKVDLRQTAPATWVLLGEAKSKSLHVGRALLSPAAAAELLQAYLVKGMLATTAIEGNTLSEDEVRRILDHTLELPPSREYLEREIENVLAAYNVARKELLDDPDLPFSVARLCEYNRLILEGLDVDEGVVPGRIRQHSVVVGTYKAVPAAEAELLLARLCDWLNGEDFDPPPDAPQLAAPLAVVKAIVAHLYLAWIHPFGDGNGRTARLLELQILLGAGFPVPTCQLLSNHYNLTRSEYYRQLTISSRSHDGVRSFLHYAAQGFVDQLREQLDVIRKVQFADRWEQFVYQSFGERRGDTDNRRLQLVLDLSRVFQQEGDPVPKRSIPTLSPRLAAAYASKTEKTLSRDLNAIKGLGLLRQLPDGWVPADESIQSLLP
ncbi:MAG: Fic family protein, partial [Thermoleophilia bacterium]|nr:Fic family protein [Thermoleophilia bacterium]